MSDEARSRSGARAISGGAVWGALGVGLGAFGAHALPEMIGERSEQELRAALETWRTAASYHLYHALALVAWGTYRKCSGNYSNAATGVCLAAGSLVFSGSLYALVLTEIKSLGAITPIGGVLLIVGWLLWAVSAWPRWDIPKRDA